MKNYIIDLSDKAKQDIKKIKNSGDKPTFDKINLLLKELATEPRDGIGKPEKLKSNSKYWSRRITQKHRMIYEIKEEIVVVYVISAYGHYDDK
jgi:toxin YoeB